MFGILQRYIMGEILRAFLLALLTITTIIVLFMVMIEASRMGLSPREILNLVPFVIPNSLPYTIPVSLLFSVTVVYGRLASDNEVVAIKTAGMSAMFVLAPAFSLGIILSAFMLFMSYEPIPVANTKAKLIIFKNMEEMFYKFLKKDREFNNPEWPFLITVRDVEEKTMIGATFKRRATKKPGQAENPNHFDMVIQARKAVIHFDTPNNMARVYLDGAEISDPRKDVSLINDSILDMPIPRQGDKFFEKKSQEMTTPELLVEQQKNRRLMAKERKRQAMASALRIAAGRLDWVEWGLVQRSFIDYGDWEMKCRAYETEKQQRSAMSCGSLFFVLLGAPVGVLFARRDFLNAFISCFVPIILVYYPLILLGTNMGKDGLLNATVALWLGNGVLAALTGLVLPSIMKH